MKFSDLFCVLLLYVSVFSSCLSSFAIPGVNKLRDLFGVDLDLYTFTGSEADDGFLPEIGNGHIATQVKNKYIFMNGIYNGAGIQSHRAGIPSTINWNVSSLDNLTETIDSLDSVYGVFREIWIYKDYNISLSAYVSRVDKQILVRNISLETVDRNRLVTLRTVGDTFDNQSPDFDFSIQDFPGKFIIKGNTKIPENKHTQTLPVFLIVEKKPKTIVLNVTHQWTAFVTAIDNTESNALRAYNRATSTKDTLLRDHCQGWIDMWDDGFMTVVSGNEFVTKSVHAAQYYLLSSLPNKHWSLQDPSWLFYGLSPTGLGHGNTLDDYLGHVFWDMDTWMFPVVLPLHNSLARQLVKYRSVMLNSALNISRQSGYKGARYPWESARTGFETTYDPIVGRNEIHISADISFAVQQLLWMSSRHDSSLYYDLGKDIIVNIARFWMSRLKYNDTIGMFEILDVMPPDEYVQSCNNSAFTNVAVIKALQAPLLLAKRYNDTVTVEMVAWYKTSKKIVVPYNEKLNLIMEHDGYEIGTQVKQADVVLLQFPLQFTINTQCSINNLKYYGKVTDVDGPAMTWSIFSINWFSLNELIRAEQYFTKNFGYITSPFYVWSEIINGKGARNFITGIGGYLQNILYGYMGIRLEFVNNGQLVIDAKTTPLIEAIRLHNVTFQGSNIDVSVNKSHLMIHLLNGPSLLVTATEHQRQYRLTSSHNKITIADQRVVITSTD